nr:hypothetical protein [uncultured Tolumonas sp.]
MHKINSKFHSLFTQHEVETLLLTMQKAIETYRNPNHPYDDSLQDLFAGFLHLNGETRLFVEFIEQSLFDKLFDMPDEQFTLLFLFCLRYFSSPIDDVAEYFELFDRKRHTLTLDYSSASKCMDAINI